MSEFKVGEIAIWNTPSACNGDEVRITGPLRHRATFIKGHGPDVHLCYEVEYRGEIYHPAPKWLRKRRPPQDWKKLCNLADTPREIEHV